MFRYAQMYEKEMKQYKIDLDPQWGYQGFKIYLVMYFWLSTYTIFICAKLIICI